MVAAPANEGDHGDALYASSTPRSCLPCLQIATPATERGEVRSAGGRPRRWRRRRTALFRLPGQRQRPSSESRASERAAKAAAATLLHGLVRRRRARSCRARVGPGQAVGSGPRGVSSVRRTAPTRSRRAALLLISSTDAASSTSDAAGGRGTRHPSAVALPRWRARTRRVRAQPRTSRARYCCSRRRGELLRYSGRRLRLHAGRFVK